MKLCVIVNVVPSLFLGEATLEKVKERYNSQKDPETELFWSFSVKGTGLIQQNYEIELGATYVMEQVLKVDENFYDGVIVTCGLDPCLVAAREYLRIPVVGMLSTGVNLASILGRKFSIVYAKSPGSKYAPMDLIRAYAMETKLASIRSTVTPATEFHALPSDQRLQEIITQARKAIDEDGADVILLGCGGFEGFQVLSDKLGVPVIDMGIATLKMCELLVKLGLSHSKVAYPNPSKAIPQNLFKL